MSQAVRRLYAFATLGSAGDVYPLLAIARALAERGQAVVMLAQAPWADAAAREGLRFMSIASSKAHARTLAHPKLWHPVDGLGVLWRHLGVPAVAPTLAALAALQAEVGVGGRLTVLASPLVLGARLHRERVPDSRLLTAWLAPFSLRSTADPMVLGHWQLPSATPLWLRRALWAALDAVKLDPLMRPALRQAARVHGIALPERQVFARTLPSPDGGIALFEPPLGCDAQAAPHPLFKAGFARFVATAEAASDAALSPTNPAVARFLAAGEPPLLIYPGSAWQGDGQTLWPGPAALHALQQAGFQRRMHIQPLAHLPAADANTLLVDWAHLPALLPRCAAVVHHGGVGMVADALAAGTPQGILAMGFDQPHNAALLAAQRLAVWMPQGAAPAERWLHWAQALRALPAPSPLAWAPSLPGAPNAAVRAACAVLQRA